MQTRLLVAVMAALVKGSQAGYEQWPAAPPAYQYGGTTLLAEQVALDIAVTTLQNLTSPFVFRCAAISLMDACFSEGSNTVAKCSDAATLDGQGDGFVRLTTSSLTSKGNAILQAPAGSTVPLSTADVEGAYVSVLNQLAARTGVKVIFEAPWLPLDIRLTQDRIAQMVYVFDVLKYDCLLASTVVAFERTPYTRFSVPIQPWGSIVLVPQPTIKKPTLLTRLFTWVTPFTGEAWIVLIGGCCLVGMLMTTFEMGHPSGDFANIVSDSAVRSRMLQIWEGIYRSFAHLTASGGYEPVTLAGRVLYIFYAFTVWLILSCYIANLASLLVVTPTPFQPIQSISDLANGIFPVCVLDKHVFQHTLIRSYPGVRMIVLNASTGNAAVQALSAPNSPCRAVVAPNVLLQYAMGPVADPNGQYCGLNFAGSPLDFGFYAIPFNRNIPGYLVDAMDVLILSIMDSGNYTASTRQFDFPVTRPRCAQQQAEVAAAASAAAKEPPPLGLPDIAGIFLVLVVGVFFSSVIHLAWKKLDAVGQRAAAGAGDGSRAGRGGKGEAPAIPTTFIDDGFAPNPSVDRIVSQAVDAIRREVVASLGKITREQLILQRSNSALLQQPAKTAALQSEDSEPATLLDGGRGKAPPQGLRRLYPGSQNKSRPPPAGGGGSAGYMDSGRGALPGSPGAADASPAPQQHTLPPRRVHSDTSENGNGSQQQGNVFGLFTFSPFAGGAGAGGGQQGNAPPKGAPQRSSFRG